MLIKHRVYSSQKPGFYELCQAVKKVVNQSKIIPTLYNNIEVFSSASDGSKSVADIFSKVLILMTQLILNLIFLLELIWDWIIAP